MAKETIFLIIKIKIINIIAYAILNKNNKI